MAQSRVVLNVFGGVVQDVFSSDAAIEVVIVDWDTEGADLDASGLVEIADGGGHVSRAFISRPPVRPTSELAGTDASAALRKAGINDEGD
jgi:hypothetical protein